MGFNMSPWHPDICSIFAAFVPPLSLHSLPTSFSSEDIKFHLLRTLEVGIHSCACLAKYKYILNCFRRLLYF